ncbi:ABC transporter permease [Raineyella sp. LH-20]|uniref:ABC transporter permease n=1 Tax=Raineyella sp. LH-20 TaxID=3081204 RepID=UPI0029555D04|nr:ABC transporter permease [Raineyella sp. LH-20]WOP19199.1 ABC transporter permease [Raineyella sp. LH-20]
MKLRNLNLSKYSIYLILLAMFIGSSFLSPNFLTAENMTNIPRQLTVTTILAFGEMMLIICGMIDLSAGSVLALAGVLSVVAYKATDSIIVALVVGIVVGVVCNLISAVMTADFDVPPFIATLAVGMVARGAVLLYTRGQNILQLGKFTDLGQGSIGPIPIPVIFLLVAVGLTGYLMNQTKYGRALYAIGGNELAARASGINVRKTKYQAFILNGIFVGVAGVLFMSRVNAGLPNGAVGYEMEGLTSAVVGGTSFTGGVGTTLGTLAGAFIIGLLNNIMNLVGVQSYVQQITKGVIIAVAVMYDIRSKRAKRTHVILKPDLSESRPTPPEPSLQK